MVSLFIEAGWGILPTAVLSFFSVVLALGYAITLRRSIFSLTLCFAILTLVVAAIGTLSGFRVAAEAATDWQLLAIGAKESTASLLVALNAAVATGVVIAVGLFRVAWNDGE